jgi:hypothetical protein
MGSGPEKVTSRAVREALTGLPAGAAVPDSEPFRRALAGLAWFLPEVLGELHREWSGQGLDGIYPQTARKAGERELELLGLCCLLEEQTLVPLHVRLQLAADADAVAWLELRLGERGRSRVGLVGQPYPQSGSLNNRLRAVGQRAGAIEWAYQVNFGERQ